MQISATKGLGLSHVKPTKLCELSSRSLPTAKFLSKEFAHHRQRQNCVKVAATSQTPPAVAAASFSTDDEGASPLQPLAGNSPLAEVEAQGEQSLAYLILTACFVATGLTELVVPSTVLENVFAVSSYQHTLGLVQILGSLHVMVATATFCLAKAAQNNRLGSSTYLRLNIGLVAFGCVSLAALYSGPVYTVGVDSFFAYALSVLAVVTGARTFYAHSGATLSQQPRALFQGFVQFIKDLKIHGGIQGFVYGLGTKAALLGSLAMWSGSLKVVKKSLLTVSIGPLGLSLLRHSAACMLLAAAIFYVINDAHSRGRLGASTFRLLNLGVAFVAWTTVAMYVEWALQGILVLNASGAVDAIKVLSGTKAFALLALGITCTRNWWIYRK